MHRWSISVSTESGLVELELDSLLYSLNAKGDQRHSHHQQVQEVEIVPAESSFMKEGSVRRHL